MGSITYDFLTHCDLFDEQLIDSGFEGVPEAEIIDLLDGYRTHVLSNETSLRREFVDTDTPVRLFIENLDVKLLRSASLYVPQIVIEDPLFAMTAKESETAKIGKQALGFESKFDRGGLAKILQTFKQITPLIAHDYVKLVPASFNRERPNFGITYSPNQYRDILPAAISDYCWENVKVRTMRQSPLGWEVRDVIEPARGLYITFGDYGNGMGNIFNLFDIELLEKEDPNEDPNIVRYIQWMPEEPPSEDRFESWLVQSVNSSAIHTVNEIVSAARSANRYGSSLLTHSSFASSLLGVEADDTPQQRALIGTLGLELPLLEDLSFEDLMEVRSSSKEAFANFRIELEKNFRSLKDIDNAEEVQRATANVRHELMEVQLPRIQKSVTNFWKGAPFKVAPVLLNLFGSLSTGITLIASVIGVANVVSSTRDYVSKVKENPAYFLWKLSRRGGENPLPNSNPPDQLIKDVNYRNLEMLIINPNNTHNR